MKQARADHHEAAALKVAALKMATLQMATLQAAALDGQVEAEHCEDLLGH